VRNEATSVIDPREGFQLVQNYKTLIVINKVEAVRFCGLTVDLNEKELKTLILRKKNTGMRSPAIFIRRESIVIIGWSKYMWSQYLASK